VYGLGWRYKKKKREVEMKALMVAVMAFVIAFAGYAAAEDLMEKDLKSSLTSTQRQAVMEIRSFLQPISEAI